MRAWRRGMARAAEFFWPAVALVLGLAWFGDALINKVFDGDIGIAVAELLLAAGALGYAYKGTRRALTPSVRLPSPEPLVVTPDRPLAYAMTTRRVLQIAESRTPADCVTRTDLLEALRSDDDAGIWTRWCLRHPLPVADDDVSEQVLAMLGTGDEVVGAVFTVEALRAVEIAERLAHHCEMESVRPGHLAAALVASAGNDPISAGELLHDYLGSEFPGIESALRNLPSPAPSGASSAAPSERRRVCPTPADKSALGRWAYPVGAVLIVFGVAPLFADIPVLVSDAGQIADAEAAIQERDFAKATILLDDVAQRYPDSVSVYTGRACIAALQGAQEAWALNVQLALFVGMSWTTVGQCRPADELGEFVLVRTGAGVLLHVRPAGRVAAIAARSAQSATLEDAITEMAAASCANGVGGYPMLGNIQAFAALNHAASIDVYSLAAEPLKACVIDWPQGRPRTTVMQWVK